MQRTPVTSSNIRSIGYDSTSETLEVEFTSGDVYQYAGVHVNEYEGVLRATSKGTYLNARIKDRYSCTKL